MKAAKCHKERELKATGYGTEQLNSATKQKMCLRRFNIDRSIVGRVDERRVNEL